MGPGEWPWHRGKKSFKSGGTGRQIRREIFPATYVDLEILGRSAEEQIEAEHPNLEVWLLGNPYAKRAGYSGTRALGYPSAKEILKPGINSSGLGTILLTILPLPSISVCTRPTSLMLGHGKLPTYSTNCGHTLNQISFTK